MLKKFIFAIVILLILVGTLGGIKALQIGKMVDQGKQFAPPPETVTAAQVRSEDWESVLSAVGSLQAVQGVTVAAEMRGRIVKIAFQPGANVQKGDLLIQQDTSTENAQLRAARASLALARSELERRKALINRRTISQSDFDKVEAQFKQALAEVDNIKTIIEKKTVRAPFSGRLGIRLVDLGQILNEGEPIVSLQALDPIFVDFFLPQQKLAQISEGLTVRILTDANPGDPIEGEVTAINPLVDTRTRNVLIQATVSNPGEKLRPGMFVNVSMVLPARAKVLSIPATAVLYAPYSDSVFVVEEKRGQDGQSTLTVQQQFVRLGEKNGDFIAVVDGLKDGQTVVSTGVFKLRNGQSVVVDNELAPDFKRTPTPADS